MISRPNNLRHKATARSARRRSSNLKVVLTSMKRERQLSPEQHSKSNMKRKAARVSPMNQSATISSCQPKSFIFDEPPSCEKKGGFASSQKDESVTELPTRSSSIQALSCVASHLYINETIRIRRCQFSHITHLRARSQPAQPMPPQNLTLLSTLSTFPPTSPRNNSSSRLSFESLSSSCFEQVQVGEGRRSLPYLHRKPRGRYNHHPISGEPIGYAHADAYADAYARAAEKAYARAHGFHSGCGHDNLQQNYRYACVHAHAREHAHTPHLLVRMREPKCQNESVAGTDQATQELQLSHHILTSSVGMESMIDVHPAVGGDGTQLELEIQSVLDTLVEIVEFVAKPASSLKPAIGVDDIARTYSNSYAFHLQFRQHRLAAKTQDTSPP